jgi:hypothetical protein
MNLRLSASLWAGAVSLVQGIGITYVATTPQPQNWEDFITVKFVMALILLLGGNTPLAHKSFRDKNSRTRESDSFVLIPDNLKEKK